MKEITFQKNILLKDYTTYKIGGPAEYFFVARTKKELTEALKTAEELKLPAFILGGGSNILVSDKGRRGLVVKLEICDFVPCQDGVQSGAGVPLSKLVSYATENGFTGLEWAAGVPGTLGGAIYGHAQAFGSKISDVIKSVEVLDKKTLEIKRLSKKQCNFSLKDSAFKKNKNLIIISAVLEFEKAGKEEIKEKIDKFLAYRKSGHPLSSPSAGSVFVNPETKITDEKLLEKYPALKEFNKRGVIPSGYLIEEAGLTGKTIGNAQISKIHANFIINLGDAKAQDVMALIELAQKEVKKTFGIELKPEVQFVGF